MEKSFLVILAVVVIVGFSASTYIFSQLDISLEFDTVSDRLSDKKTQIINEINRCMSQNTVADGSVTLNSFERNLLSSVTEQVKNAEDGKTLEDITSRIYTMTSCKPE
jgi:hypothetical protein